MSKFSYHPHRFISVYFAVKPAIKHKNLLTIFFYIKSGMGYSIILINMIIKSKISFFSFKTFTIVQDEATIICNNITMIIIAKQFYDFN